MHFSAFHLLSKGYAFFMCFSFLLFFLIVLIRISFHKLKHLNDTQRRRQNELNLKILRILRALVRNEMVKIDPNLQEDDPAGYRRHCIHKLHPMQNKLQSFGKVVSRVMSDQE